MAELELPTLGREVAPFTAAGLAEQLTTPQHVLEVVLAELVEGGWLERTLLPLDGCNGGNCSHSNGVIFWPGGLNRRRQPLGTPRRRKR
jgi:hypothetical protein